MTEASDSLDWEEWQTLTDAQQDVQLEIALAAYQRMLDAMGPGEYYGYRRRKGVELCLKQRKLIQSFPEVSFFKQQLKKTQKRLLEARVERRTGQTPGHA